MLTSASSSTSALHIGDVSQDVVCAHLLKGRKAARNRIPRGLNHPSDIAEHNPYLVHEIHPESISARLRRKTRSRDTSAGLSIVIRSGLCGWALQLPLSHLVPLSQSAFKWVLDSNPDLCRSALVSSTFDTPSGLNPSVLEPRFLGDFKTARSSSWTSSSTEMGRVKGSNCFRRPAS